MAKKEEKKVKVNAHEQQKADRAAAADEHDKIHAKRVKATKYA